MPATVTAKARAAGCGITLSFDKRLAVLPGVELLP